MLSMEPRVAAYDSILKSATKDIRNDIAEMQLGRTHYVTPDVNQNLNRLSRGINDMHLDSTLLTSSPEWANKFDKECLMSEKAAANQSLDRTSAVLRNVKDQMKQDNVSNMQDNQAREIHHWATTNLKDAQQGLDPYKDASVKRLKQFCDHVGVTDRYTGYRHNLNRGRINSAQQGSRWKPKEYRNTASVQRSCTSAPPGGRHVTWSDIKGSSSKIQLSRQNSANPLALTERSIQERCGINTTFPERTEYMISYPEPTKYASVGFIVNPTPNFLMHGRPLGEMQAYPNNTEYQFRYEWPDSEKITKLPWIRK